ncbi:phage tail protein [Flavobacteriaceae bacterium]|nr:phage tail protein [Flavobacteriaceae bacterium]
MKPLFTSLFILLFSGLVMGQAHVTSSGISIQGIARDANNSALSNLNDLSLDFVIYYLGSGNSENLIHQESGSVSTDAFGVFSYVVSINSSNFTKIANKESYLKVSQGSAIFSNEKLHAVPYAIHAQNGVPTGSIMPFVGNSSNVPAGWLLCDGSSFTDDVYHAKLKSLLGSTSTPNLSGTYLRGTGTTGNHVGPGLNSFQNDQTKEHRHAVSLSGNTNTDGAHRHRLPMDQRGNQTIQTLYDTSGYDEGWVDQGSDMEGQSEHSHALTLSGNTNNTGSAEVRVYGYGVNYIIKI